MLNSIFAKACAAVLLGLAAALTPVRQADAAMFVGTFDPAFGLAFPDLGFRGNVTFDVPESCLAQNGFCTDSPLSMISAAVTLYDLNNLDNSRQVGFGFFSPLTNVYIQGGTLFGVNSPIIGPEFTFTDGFIYTGAVFLQFELLSGEAGLGTPSAFIYACPTDNNQCSSNQAIRSNPARLSFVSVPEPGSTALLLLALALAAAARRRRAR